MELAIPLIALGGMYVISNKNNETSKNAYNESYTNKKENFDNMGRKPNYLPNTNVAPQNYPIMNNPELIDTVQEYPNPNTASDKYFNQNAYEQRERKGKPVGDTIQQVYSLTGDYMNSDQFRHNNMVPFSGAKPHGQTSAPSADRCRLCGALLGIRQLPQSMASSQCLEDVDRLAHVSHGVCQSSVGGRLQRRESPDRLG